MQQLQTDLKRYPTAVRAADTVVAPAISAAGLHR
jgi:hypothetical protein